MQENILGDSLPFDHSPANGITRNPASETLNGKIENKVDASQSGGVTGQVSDGSGIGLVLKSNSSVGDVQTINSDLLSFLNVTQLDYSALQNIKDSGILYTFEELLPDGQKVKREKFVKYNELTDSIQKMIDTKLVEFKVAEQKQRKYSLKALINELI